MLAILQPAITTVATGGVDKESAVDDGATLLRNVSAASTTVLKTALLGDDNGTQILHQVGVLMHKAYELFSAGARGNLCMTVLQGLQVVRTLVAGDIETEQLSVHLLTPAVSLLISGQMDTNDHSDDIRFSLKTHLHEIAKLDETAAGLIFVMLRQPKFTPASGAMLTAIPPNA